MHAGALLTAHRWMGGTILLWLLSPRSTLPNTHLFLQREQSRVWKVADTPRGNMDMFHRAASASLWSVQFAPLCQILLFCAGPHNSPKTPPRFRQGLFLLIFWCRVVARKCQKARSLSLRLLWVWSWRCSSSLVMPQQVRYSLSFERTRRGPDVDSDADHRLSVHTMRQTVGRKKAAQNCIWSGFMPSLEDSFVPIPTCVAWN